MSRKSPSYHDKASRWSKVSQDYEHVEFSFTSFAEKRDLVVNAIKPSFVAELGCGSLGLLLKNISSKPGIQATACDFCLDMLRETRKKLRNINNINYLAADNCNLPIQSGSIDTVISINSILPENRSDIDLMFAEITRVLSPKGRLIAVLPAFEMSPIAKQHWGMVLEIDIDGHREYDSAIGSWQCFYTEADITELMERHKFRRFSVEPVIFDSPAEVEHILEVYGTAIPSAARNQLYKYPLFEHFLVGDK